MRSFSVNIVLLSSCLVYSFTKDYPLISKTLMGIIVSCFVYNVFHFAAMLFTSSHLNKALKDKEKGLRFTAEMFRQKLIPVKFENDEWYLELSAKQTVIYCLAALYVFLRLDLYEFVISCTILDLISFILFFEQTKILNILLNNTAHKKI